MGVAAVALIVGLGNPLRRDDGLGPAIVAALERQLRGTAALVRTLILPQLDVTLALDMKAVDLVVFVDARTGEAEGLVKMERVTASDSLRQSHTSHLLDPKQLLFILREWFGRTPECLLVLPKGEDFGLGEGLSQTGADACVEAVSRIQGILQDRSLLLLRS